MTPKEKEFRRKKLKVMRHIHDSLILLGYQPRNAKLLTVEASKHKNFKKLVDRYEV